MALENLLAKHGKKPAGFINTEHLDPNLVEGSILTDIPVLCYPEQDPYPLISSRDRIEIDGENGLPVVLSPGAGNG